MSESIITINEFGDKFWKNRTNECHRLDGPAIEWSNGTKEWWRNGQLHRIDGPAIEYADGTKKWYQKDEFHRVDGPAIEWSNGKKEWCQNGLLHRVDGPAIEWFNGNTSWCFEGRFFGCNIEGFWKFWDHLNDEERQNVNLHMWLMKLTNS